MYHLAIRRSTNIADQSILCVNQLVQSILKYMFCGTALPQWFFMCCMFNKRVITHQCDNYRDNYLFTISCQGDILQYQWSMSEHVGGSGIAWCVSSCVFETCMCL